MNKKNRLKWKVSLALSMALALPMVSGPFDPMASVLYGTASAATQSIASSVLSVDLDTTFPKVNQYTWLANGAVMYGSEDTLNQIYINGTAYTPAVIFSMPSLDTALYTLTISSIQIVITAQMKVVNNTLLFDITNIAENGATQVNTLEIRNHNLLSVRSSQTGATFAGNKMYTAVTGTGDTIKSVSGSPAADASPVDYMYAFVNTNQLAGGLWSNSVYENSDNNGRVREQTVAKTGYSRTGLWSGAWMYRANGMTTTDPLPSAKVIITPDANSDGTVDWQDGAIAYRTIMNNPLGAEKVPDLVVQRIPMNFASQATNPFTKTLDETKRVYNATDGLGQMVLLKGYASEGHDSGHPDYGDVGQRQGGVADMNALVNAGSAYNAFFGVHINATESYPEAQAFNETLVNKNSPGWDWLDSSYYINKRYDSTSGNRLSRLQQLKNQVPNLGYIYIDVWQSNGWDSRKTAREVNSLGWPLATEFPSDHEYDSIWNHWAVDYNYGGTNIKGFNSQIARFIRNHQKDTWIARDPLLGGTELSAYEGWQGKTNFDSMVGMTFATDLPTKYLQHFKITKWTTDTINFENNVSVSNASGTRLIAKDGRTILNGGAYLLPWSPSTEDKLYHWNSVAGSTSWQLPVSWAGLSTVKLYQLSDQGRQFVGDLAVTNNQITISASANKAYVVYKGSAPANTSLNYGEGAGIADPGFNNGNLSAWTVAGSGASVQRNANGQYELQIGYSSGATTVSQTLTGLTQGTYYASVYVSTGGGRKAYLGVNNYGGADVSTYANSSLWKNYIQADSKRDTTMQRMYVWFDVPAGATTATLYLKTDAGTSTVTFDDVRLEKSTKTPNPNNDYFVQDFENVPDGWYPFVKGPAGGTNDPRTHLMKLHAPFSQKGWDGKTIDDVLNGKWSLMAHKESSGLLYQTIPQTLRFVPGTTYTVTFTYENQASGDYAFVVGDGTSVVSTTSLGTVATPTTFSKVFTAAASGNSWIGIQKVTGNATDFIMDDLKVALGGTVPVDPAVIPQSQMTAAATSEETVNDSNGAANVLDGNLSTIWHTKWDLSNPLPQSITLNLGGSYNISQLKYMPRQDGGSNGNITGYNVYISTDGTTFTKVATGTWANDASEKSAVFTATTAAYIRLEATSGTGGWASAAELNVYKASGIGTSYTQDFNNGIAGWNRVIGTGTVSALSGGLNINASNSSTVAVDSNSPAKADGVYTFKVTPQNANGRFQAVFRYTGMNSWAAIGYDLGTSWAWSNGAGQYGNFTGPTLASGTTYAIKVQFTGPNVTLWVDGAQVYSGTLTNIPIGAGQIGFRSWNVGNMLFDDVSYSSNDPVNPPVTTDNAPAGWVNGDVTVTLTAKDSGSGVANTYYKVDGGAQQQGNSIVITEEGKHSISYWSVDMAGNAESPHTAVVQIDKTPPTLKVYLDKTVLLPPNHQLVTVSASVYANDSLSGTASVVLTSITVDEGDNGLGDGNTTNDIQGVQIGTLDTEFMLRAERSGKGNGRIYTITYTVIDHAGNKTATSATVTVPHN
ncbi:endo-alpha-N-acetylgalactosaminidase family protein [Paenibacillus sp. GCM10027628]|uniref:endo-alpha-N-acetylgalactosaminidase family protein n=1 Tax=Paenibacillus sp. GCM10027628 TaxID=3273413 RepID=UPI003635ADE5